jgi:hypothetical protein
MRKQQRVAHAAARHAAAVTRAKRAEGSQPAGQVPSFHDCFKIKSFLGHSKAIIKQYLIKIGAHSKANSKAKK